MSARFRRPLVGPTFWLLLFAAIVAIRLATRTAEPKPPEDLAEGAYDVQYVVDGDTLRLEGGARVRLQGIDTPECARDGQPEQPYSREATEFVETFVRNASGQVHLTFGAERVDRYGRHLAFVWHGEQLLNEQLVLSGLAQARPDYRFSGRMKKRLVAAEQQARAAQAGMWTSVSPQ